MKHKETWARDNGWDEIIKWMERKMIRFCQEHWN